MWKNSDSTIPANSNLRTLKGVQLRLEYFFLSAIVYSFSHPHIHCRLSHNINAGKGNLKKDVDQ